MRNKAEQPPGRWALAGRAGGLRRAAFTLIELIVVVTIMALLVGLLLPSVSYGVRQALATHAQAKIASLDNAARAYEQETGYFPGRRDTDIIGSGTSDFTGSQILAACLFDYRYKYIQDNVFTDDDTHVDYPRCYPKSKYGVHHKGETLDTINLKSNTLSDGFWADSMAICYYVSWPGEKDFSQFHYDDNSVYTGESDKRDDFERFIQRQAFGQVRPHNEGEFLLISAGADREFFTHDDGKNWRTSE